MSDLFNAVVGFAFRAIAGAAEKLDAALFHDWDLPLARVTDEPATLPLPNLCGGFGGPELPPLPAEGDYLTDEPTEFEKELYESIQYFNLKDGDPIDYLHQCLNAWGRA